MVMSTTASGSRGAPRGAKEKLSFLLILTDLYVWGTLNKSTPYIEIK